MRLPEGSSPLSGINICQHSLGQNVSPKHKEHFDPIEFKPIWEQYMERFLSVLNEL